MRALVGAQAFIIKYIKTHQLYREKKQTLCEIGAEIQLSLAYQTVSFNFRINAADKLFQFINILFDACV